ncbi:MAG: hypothetical protein IOB84_13715 [Brevundimonas sp.]|nr:hypothetical protein [Brevundimonas sp.]
MAYVPFTRPADTTAYASGDLVANSTTAGSVASVLLEPGVAAGGQRLVRRVRLRKSTTVLTDALFRVHLYAGAAPTFANGDNAAWSTNGFDRYLGSVDVLMDRAFTDGAMGLASPAMDIQYDGSLDLRAVVEARAVYGPGNAEVFGVDAEWVAL